jgi:hypothetical protein
MAVFRLDRFNYTGYAPPSGRAPSKTAREVPMLYSVPFAHSASECPAANKVQMDGIRQMLSPENLKPRGIRLVEGYVDRL